MNKVYSSCHPCWYYSTAIRTAGFCSCWHVRECIWLFSTINALGMCVVTDLSSTALFSSLCLHLLSFQRSFIRSFVGSPFLCFACTEGTTWLTTVFSNHLYCPFLNKLRLSALFALPFICQKSKANFSQTWKSTLTLFFCFSFLK